MKAIFKSALVLFVATTVLSGCLDPQTETEKKLAEIVKNQRAPLTVMPDYDNSLVITYIGADNRSPFVPTSHYEKYKDVTFNYVQVNENRKKTYLESFPLETLKYHGLLKKKGNISAVVETPEQEIFTVSIGQYLGDSNGKLKVINADNLIVAEAISDGLGRYIEQPFTLEISEKNQTK